MKITLNLSKQVTGISSTDYVDSGVDISSVCYTLDKDWVTFDPVIVDVEIFAPIVPSVKIVAYFQNIMFSFQSLKHFEYFSKH